MFRFSIHFTCSYGFRLSWTLFTAIKWLKSWIQYEVSWKSAPPRYSKKSQKLNSIQIEFQDHSFLFSPLFSPFSFPLSLFPFLFFLILLIHPIFLFVLVPKTIFHFSFTFSLLFFLSSYLHHCQLHYICKQMSIHDPVFKRSGVFREGHNAFIFILIGNLWKKENFFFYYLLMFVKLI